ncbi:cysteine proteinase [Zopfia rhizophila CBS 207.26]|uniref:ubiquitinyl hydrolase 1 n=1 Tax=Zopfia rhizophila CBS 207.26 TaxID=1314779 RepID=A0A6A6DFP0_9PEZI|nr:cysteine proteinase [Zopfia rhizophila CBS 207.26]
MSSRPGKTAPRLLQDLLTYDPRHEERAGRNLLIDPPPHHDPDAEPAAAVPYRNCRHSFMTKHEQSVLPKAGEDPDHDTIYKVASFCQKCRWHLDLVVDFRDNGSKISPCHTATEGYPIHHFIYQVEDTSQRDPFGNQSVPRNYRFLCSAPKCPVELKIRMLPPRFNEHYISLMTNRALLRKRLESSRQIDPARADDLMARSVDAFDFLSTYLQDSLQPKTGKSRIPLLNRKFLKTFGRDCDQILKDLGFTHSIEVEDDGTNVEAWYLPRPPPASHALDQDNERTKIEDARHELGALILKFPESERTGAKNPMMHPQPSLTEIQRALGCLDYAKRYMTRSESRSTNHEEDHPYYAGLGAVGDFADSLLLFAWARQTAVDTVNSTYYFECLQSIAIGRNSQMLGEHVQMLASQGHTNRKEVAKAYSALGIDPAHSAHLTDDIIIGQFRARLQDIAPSAVEGTRNMLRVIGAARHSELIQLEASNAIRTYSQALSWLDLDEGQPDEFVETMFTVKKEGNEDIARRAVQIIAEHRKSQRLMDFLKTGHVSEEAEMDVAEAYAFLGINERAERLSLDVLQAQLMTWTTGNPENAAKYEKAYQMILKDQQENHKNVADGQHDPYPPRKKYPLEIWPVGCQNIGNTCYLNSVLQFLFTIKPVREMILNCDGYMQECTPKALETKRVGRSAVTVEKVQKAQEFVRELRKLFNLMITAPSETVLPEIRLASLALAKNDTIIEKPTQNHTFGLGDIGGKPVSGPMPNPDAVAQPELADSVMGDDEITKKSDTSSTVAEIDLDDDRALDITSNGDVEQPVSQPPPPTRPPPVPPRPNVAVQANPEVKALEAVAQQQDAAEILNNIFDLLSCAMKGEGTLRDGEQQDMIKKLFFSDVTTVRTSKGVTARNSALQDNHLISPGNRDRPLYAALDDEFGKAVLDDNPSEKTQQTTKYEYIEHASPIQIVNVRRLVFEEGRSKKDHSHVGLDDTLYLDRYLKQTTSLSEEELLQRRERQWNLQRNLKEMEARKAELNQTELKITLPEVVDGAANFVEDLNKTSEETLIDLDEDSIPNYPNLAGEMREGASELQKEADTLDEKMKEIDKKTNDLFADCKGHPYRLHSVFMHRGSATGGHYWIFIHDFQNKVWRKYNDERVDEVEDLDDIFKQEGANPATSTGIVYVRDDLVMDLTEAVKRDPAKPPSNEVEMKDAGSAEFEDVEIINGVEES